MNKRSTLDSLVLYLYNETELTDSVLVQDAIDHDDEIAETYNSLIQARDLIHQTLLSPEPILRENIMLYAKLTAAHA